MFSKRGFELWARARNAGADAQPPRYAIEEGSATRVRNPAPRQIQQPPEWAVPSAAAADGCVTDSWAEAPIKIARMTLTIKLDGNWSSFQLANNTPPLSVTGSVIAPSARMAVPPTRHTHHKKRHCADVFHAPAVGKGPCEPKTRSRQQDRKRSALARAQQQTQCKVKVGSPKLPQKFVKSH